MSDEGNCPDCGVWWEEHGYEHLARVCYPGLVEKMEARIAQLEAALLAATEDEDALCDCECACRGHHLNYCQLMRIEKALGHGLAEFRSMRTIEPGK